MGSISLMTTQFAVYIEKDEDGMFIGSIPLIPGCHAEGKTQEKMLENLSDVLKLCLRNVDTSFLRKVHFVGIQNLNTSYA